MSRQRLEQHPHGEWWETKPSSLPTASEAEARSGGRRCGFDIEVGPCAAAWRCHGVAENAHH